MVFKMSPTNKQDSIFSDSTWNATEESWSFIFCIVCLFPCSHVLATTKVLTQVRLCLQLKSCRKSICRDVAMAQVASNGNVLFTLPLLATFYWRTTLSSKKRTRCGIVPRRRRRKTCDSCERGGQRRKASCVSCERGGLRRKASCVACERGGLRRKASCVSCERGGLRRSRADGPGRSRGLAACCQECCDRIRLACDYLQ
jgi:hypothetical protein